MAGQAPQHTNRREFLGVAACTGMGALSGAAGLATRRAQTAEIVALAVESGGAHAIKLSEACLREEALAHDPILLQAASEAARSMAG